MGLSIYFEDQIHRRTYGPEFGARLSRVLEVADPEGLLAGVDIYGDTMFNLIQLPRLDREFAAIAAGHPELASDVEALRAAVKQTIRNRGYIWISGD